LFVTGSRRKYAAFKFTDSLFHLLHHLFLDFPSCYLHFLFLIYVFFFFHFLTYTLCFSKVSSNPTVHSFGYYFLSNVSRVLPSSAAKGPYILLSPLSDIYYDPISPSNIICPFSPNINYVSSYSCCSSLSLIPFIIFLIFPLFPSLLYSSSDFSLISSPLSLSYSAPLPIFTIHVLLSPPCHKVLSPQLCWHVIWRYPNRIMAGTPAVCSVKHRDNIVQCIWST
jgi:hypothetical protein